MRELLSLYDGTLGEVVTMENSINITEGSPTVSQLPYSAIPGARELIKKKVEKMLQIALI